MSTTFPIRIDLDEVIPLAIDLVVAQLDDGEIDAEERAQLAARARDALADGRTLREVVADLHGWAKQALDRTRKPERLRARGRRKIARGEELLALADRLEAEQAARS